MKRSEISCNRIYNLCLQAIKVHICTLDIVRLTDCNVYIMIWEVDYMTVSIDTM